MKTSWKSIVVFLVIAFGISAAVHLGYLDEVIKELFKDSIISSWVYMFAGFGPLLAGIICLLIFKSTSSDISIFGFESQKNILIATLPILSFTVIGFENSNGMNTHLYGFLYAFVNIIYAFFEEFGWRRFLQNALQNINKNLKYLLIGVIWWIWHLRFQSQFDLLVFPLICIGGGFLLGKLADEAKSILPVMTMHTLIILLTNSGAITNNKLIGVGITIVLWVIIERVYRKTNALKFTRK